MVIWIYGCTELNVRSPVDGGNNEAGTLTLSEPLDLN